MTAEPEIIINGKCLTNAQAMTLRVAINNFMMDLKSDGLGDDEYGMSMVKLYNKNLREIQDMIFSANGEATKT